MWSSYDELINAHQISLKWVISFWLTQGLYLVTTGVLGIKSLNISMRTFRILMGESAILLAIFYDYNIPKIFKSVHVKWEIKKLEKM